MDVRKSSRVTDAPRRDSRNLLRHTHGCLMFGDLLDLGLESTGYASNGQHDPKPFSQQIVPPRSLTRFIHKCLKNDYNNEKPLGYGSES